MNKGIVKWFNGTKGYGFITNSDSGEDVFVHLPELSQKALKLWKKDSPSPLTSRKATADRRQPMLL